MQAIQLVLHVSIVVEYSGLISLPLHTPIKKERGGRQREREHIPLDMNVSAKEKVKFTIVNDVQSYRLYKCK